MAGIDKTYTDSYTEYKEFKDWADEQFVTFFDGLTICIGNYVRDYDESDFDGEEIPIMNTPSWVDAYLIQNCKQEFVISRLQCVYSKEAYQDLAKADLSAAPPKEYKQNRKIIIEEIPGRTQFPLHTAPYNSKRKKKFGWWLQCDDWFDYYELTGRWVHSDALYPSNTNTAHWMCSLKAIVRHLRKQYLPAGISFRLMGNYRGEVYSVRIK